MIEKWWALQLDRWNFFMEYWYVEVSLLVILTAVLYIGYKYGRREE